MDGQMNEMGLTILDGTDLRRGDLRLPIFSDEAFSCQKILEMAESEASARLFGLSLPDSLRSAVLRRLESGTDNLQSMELNGAEFQKKKFNDFILSLAEELEDDPLVVSVLDGSSLRSILDDEDDFAMVAENVFTDLDTNDTGKLSRSKIQDVLSHMGPEMGVPPFSACVDLLNNILKKHGVEKDEQLGQAQFAQLLQPILQDLADALAAKPVTVIQNIKVINGSRLKKILNNNKLLNDVTGRIFLEWKESCNGAWNKEALGALLRGKGSELGLPPYDSNEEINSLYDQIFLNTSSEKATGNWDNSESFEDEIKLVFKKLAEQLEENPILIDRES